jgi:hypothetical protein
MGGVMGWRVEAAAAARGEISLVGGRCCGEFTEAERVVAGVYTGWVARGSL